MNIPGKQIRAYSLTKTKGVGGPFGSKRTNDIQKAVTKFFQDAMRQLSSQNLSPPQIPSPLQDGEGSSPSYVSTYPSLYGSNSGEISGHNPMSNHAYKNAADHLKKNTTSLISNYLADITDKAGSAKTNELKALQNEIDGIVDHVFKQNFTYDSGITSESVSASMYKFVSDTVQSNVTGFSDQSLKNSKEDLSVKLSSYTKNPTGFNEILKFLEANKELNMKKTANYENFTEITEKAPQTIREYTSNIVSAALKSVVKSMKQKQRAVWHSGSKMSRSFKLFNTKDTVKNMIYKKKTEIAQKRDDVLKMTDLLSKVVSQQQSNQDDSNRVITEDSGLGELYGKNAESIIDEKGVKQTDTSKNRLEHLKDQIKNLKDLSSNEYATSTDTEQFRGVKRSEERTSTLFTEFINDIDDGLNKIDRGGNPELVEERLLNKLNLTLSHKIDKRTEEVFESNMEMIGLARVEQKIDNNEGYTFEATKLSAYYTLKSGVDSLNLVGSAITLAGDPVSGLSLKGTSYAIYAGVEVAAVVTLNSEIKEQVNEKKEEFKKELNTLTSDIVNKKPDAITKTIDQLIEKFNEIDHVFGEKSKLLDQQIFKAAIHSVAAGGSIASLAV